ncbi:MAG: hypothetical protein IH988_09240, partial [Planctomycetes bacterium]|nr:hypothetical protein [Planctomycetota bacterium]
LNKGDGTFAAEVRYRVGDSPRSVAIGDLDGDEDADLAVANFDSDNVSVLLNLTNGMRDECEPDCNSDGIIDSCDIAQGLSEDCNANGIPDECIELEEDCNENGTPDECDLITPFTSVSEELSPIGGNYPQSYTIPAAPLALDDVTLSFSAVADLNLETQWIDVDINGTFVGMIFTDGATDCPSTPNVDQLVLSLETYNAAVNGNDAVIGLVPTDEVVNLCFAPPSYIVVSVEYEIAVSADDNGNGIPDECESCEGDANSDGLVDPLDSGFVLARFGCDVGAGDPNCDTADMNGDGLVDPLDVGFVLARFGTCVPISGP